MSETTVTFIAKVRAKAGFEGQLGEALASLVAPTRKEHGCLSYIVHAAAEDARQFVLYESWASQAAFDAHTKSPHFANLLARMPALTDGPPTRELLRPLG